MGCGSGLSGGGAMGFEQFVSYDPADYESVEAGIKHMEDAVKDALANGYPPGKEYIYLQIGWSDQKLYDELRKAKQPYVFDVQAQIKELFDPNNVCDRMYTILPREQ
jgi:hypothetical protein